MILRLSVLTLAAVLATPPASLAAELVPAPQPGPYARMVVIQPLPGKNDAFRAGYQRHLAWHRGAGDRWSWYGWTFTLGERLGKFMDGSFFHAAADFDAAVQPAADGADNARNVVPYAEFQTHGMYERLAGLSAGAPLPDRSPYLSMTTYFVAPGQAGQFEAMVRARLDMGGAASDRYSWYRLTVGGEAPAYVLMRAVPTFGSAALEADWFGTSLPSEPVGTIIRVRSELLKFDAGMSYDPEQGQ